MNSAFAWIGAIGSAIGILSFVAASINWYGTEVKRRLNAERDFVHLKRQYESLVVAFNFQNDELMKEFDRLSRELDSRADSLDKDIGEIKALLLANLASNKRPEHKHD